MWTWASGTAGLTTLPRGRPFLWDLESSKSWQGNPGRKDTWMAQVREASCPRLFCKGVFNTLCDYNVINRDLSAQEASVSEVGEVNRSYCFATNIWNLFIILLLKLHTHGTTPYFPFALVPSNYHSILCFYEINDFEYLCRILKFLPFCNWIISLSIML